MAIYIIDEETKTLTKINEIYSNNAVIIPAFDIHSKNVGKGNGAGRIKTNAYEFCSHPDNSHIFKVLLARYSEDTNNVFHFISFGLLQLTTIATYMHQLKLQNNYLESLAIINIHGVTKAGISKLEETHMTELKGK